MANHAHAIEFIAFASASDLLTDVAFPRQARYLHDYLADLHAAVILQEGGYFDRDYLAEFSSFYGISSRGYSNLCRRLHFFADKSIQRTTLAAALGGDEASYKRLQESYLGFVVLRPIPAAPLGRTVVKWYADQYPKTPRVVSPSREYKVHICGLPLVVTGLAWQQQDSAVSACATVGLWTMFHSSAFDDQHAVPTTVEITKSAHRTASLGARMFPSTGLTFEQLCEAIKEQNLSPAIIAGDISKPGTQPVFTRTRFCGSLTSLIRSSYPVLLTGTLEGVGLHAVVATGFRSGNAISVPVGTTALQDANANFIYLHDDNLGPGVRFKVDDSSNKVVLTQSSPKQRATRAADLSVNGGYPDFIPHHMIFAVHNDLRTSPDHLHNAGSRIASEISAAIKRIGDVSGVSMHGVTYSPRFFRLAHYLNGELRRTLGSSAAILSKVRLELAEKVAPMSLYIGLVRIGLDDSTPLVDVMFDTTDSDLHHPVFATICYGWAAYEIVSALQSNDVLDFGLRIKAYNS